MPSAGIFAGISHSRRNPAPSIPIAGRTVLRKPFRSTSRPKKNVTAAASRIAGAMIST